MDGYNADPDAWIAAAGVPITAWTSTLARSWLANQSASTIRAQAQAVVAATGADQYLTDIRHLLTSPTPMYLIAGERSSAGWDVPDWANAGCAMLINIPNAGHLMMAEDPARFAKAVLHAFITGSDGSAIPSLPALRAANKQLCSRQTGATGARNRHVPRVPCPPPPDGCSLRSVSRHNAWQRHPHQ